MNELIVLLMVFVWAIGVGCGILVFMGPAKKSRDALSSMAGDMGLMTEELNRMEAYAAELEQSERQAKKELAIAIESYDRWRGEAFDTQNKLSEVTELLATEKRRAAALMGWNRIYRKGRAA